MQRKRTRQLGQGVVVALLLACAPKVTDFHPTYGPAGTEVTVNGTRLVSGQAANTTVQIGAVAQPDRVATAGQVRFHVAPGSVTGPVRVRTSRGTGTGPGVFEVVEDAADMNGSFTFGGTATVQPINVAPTGLNQSVLLAIFRARWSRNSGDFTTFLPYGDNAFNRMNDFWTEASYGLTSFQKNYLTNAIIDLPKSMDYYYHNFQQREITSRALPIAGINLPAAEALTIASGGQNISLTLAAGAHTLDEVRALVDAALAAADPTQPAPTFTFTRSGTSFLIRTTLPGQAKAKLELSGPAVPFLGFGAESFYNITGDVAPIIMVGDPIAGGQVTFPVAQNLVITTLGAPTTVTFPPSTMTMAAIVAAIQAAFPAGGQQQPYTVESAADPTDATRSMLVFRSRVSAADNDHGFKLTVGGTAAALVGFASPTLIRRYEPETFRGADAIDDGFTAFANTLPAGTDLNGVFGAARMFVGLMVDDDQFRAHYNTGTYDINGSNFQVSWFVGRQSDSPGPVFAHETGHALGFPDLYPTNVTIVGTSPGSWDVMACGRCDAHASGWLKARHHRTDQTGAWIDNAHVAVLSPPAGMTTSTWQYILTPVESPWISANPFAAVHPGVEVVHGIELIPTDPADVVFVENRQKGVYKADHLGLPVDFSMSLPSEGVTMYEGRRVPTMGLVSFLPINELSPLNNPLNALNETFDYAITNLNHINVKVLDRIANPDATAGAPSYSYFVQVTWGQGSFYDLAITPWNPPPWESPDIWVDNQVQNAWGVYTYHNAAGDPIQNGDNVAVNQDNRLYARISNLGDLPSTQDFQVIWRIAVPQVAGGEIVTELGRVTVTADVPAHGSVITPALTWHPTSSNDEHVCIKAEIVTVPGELNGTSNNAAQENFTQWYTPGASPFLPVVLTVRTQNPYKDRDADVELYVPDVPRGWTVTVDGGRFRLLPDQVHEQTITVRVYGGAFRPVIDAQGFIPSLAVNVVARTPVGDMWVPFGGLTAVVHPVNAQSTIVLQPPRTQGGIVTLGGTLASSGPLRPPLGGREVHIRLDLANQATAWLTTLTDAAGHFQVALPAYLASQTLTARAFTPGGMGFRPSQSNPVTKPGTPGVPGIDSPGPGGVIGTLKAAGHFTALVAALERTGVLTELGRSEATFTLFAPTDSAFSAMGARFAQLREDVPAMTRFLRAHIVAGRWSPFDLRNTTSLTGLDGGQLAVSATQGITVGGASVGAPIEVPGGSVFPINRALHP